MTPVRTIDKRGAREVTEAGIIGRRAAAAAFATALLAVFVVLWFVLPRLRTLR
jgi:hypothetical protein